MDRRKVIITTVGVVIIALSIFIASRLANGSGNGDIPNENEEVKLAVRTMQVKNEQLTSYIPITGRVIPHDNVELYAEVTGVSSYGARPFKTGSKFRKGEVLIKINDEEMRRSVVSRKSEFMSLLAQVVPDLKIDFPELYEPYRKYLADFDINEPLDELPEAKSEQQRLFLSGRNVYSTFYSLKEAEARLNKYRIYAPYNGVLAESLINEGTLVRTGQKLGEYIRTGIYELEASVSAGDVHYMKTGMELTMRDVNGNNNYKGTITRINESVDPTTQMVKVFLEFRNDQLRSGIYLEGKFPKENYEQAISIPTGSLVSESEVFVIRDGKAALSEVTVLDRGENTSIIKGLSDGTDLIIDDKSKAFANSSVVAVNN